MELSSIIIYFYIRVVYSVNNDIKFHFLEWIPSKILIQNVIGFDNLTTLNNILITLCLINIKYHTSKKHNILISRSRLSQLVSFCAFDCEMQPAQFNCVLKFPSKFGIFSPQMCLEFGFSVGITDLVNVRMETQLLISLSIIQQLD